MHTDVTGNLGPSQLPQPQAVAWLNGLSPERQEERHAFQVAVLPHGYKPWFLCCKSHRDHTGVCIEAGNDDNDWFRIDLSAAVDLTLSLETRDRSAGLTEAPVIYMYRDMEGVPVGGVPRVSGDSNKETDWPRLIRNGAVVISDVFFNSMPVVGKNVNEADAYWVRVRSGISSDNGSYSLRVTRK